MEKRWYKTKSQPTDRDCCQLNVKKERRYFSQEEKTLMLERQEYMCGCCGENLWKSHLEDISFSEFHAHHILPYSMGGATTLDNGVILCIDCHEYYTILSRGGYLYGGGDEGSYNAWDMQPGQVSNPSATLEAIALILQNRLNPAVLETIINAHERIPSKATLFEYSVTNET